MALVFGVNTELLRLPSIVLRTTSLALELELPIEVNEAGNDLHQAVLAAVADEFPEVDPRIIEGALETMLATAAFPSFTIRSRDNMVNSVRWITQADEKVCKICGPRHERIYAIIDVMDIWPAHPNCRCKLERLGITEAMLRAGLMLLPDALVALERGIWEAYAKLWGR